MNTVEIARTWLGTKFHHQGRKKHVGVDCIGLVIGVARELGFEVEDRLDYARQPSGGQLEAALAKYLLPCNLQVGCVALFKIKSEPQHVGIVSDYGDGFGLIHAYAQSRKVVEHGLDEFWKKRLVACYRFRL
jgi:NlpC/P60 family putative phage cell wall peptidase